MAIKEIKLGPYSDGLNTRDTASQLESTELPDALNVSIDERGSLTKRLGYERRFVNAVGSGLVNNLFDWGSRGFLVEQVGAGMHINDGAAFLTWSTDDRCGMCEFLGNLILIHPVDGVRMYDGTTVTGPFTNSPLGDCCAAWQGKVWFGGNPTTPPRVTYTDIGAMTFNVNGWVDIREKDSAKVTCLTGASGLDIAGRPGLVLCKEHSSYRIYDSATGAYNTIDASIGTASSIGAVSAYGRTYIASTHGIFYTDGINPMVEVSNRVENVFHSDVINQTRGDLCAAGRYQDRIWFSYPASGETHNSIAVEVTPSSGAIMMHTNAASAYASLGRGDTDLVMGSPTVAGRIYNSHRTGSDDGAAISSYAQAYWTEPNFGNLVRIRRARFVGYGSFSAAMYKDYESGQGLASLNVSIEGDPPEYDDGTDYDSGADYGPAFFQGFQDFYSIGTCRSFSVRFSETSTDSRESRPILGGGVREVGAWTLSHVSLMAIDLGIK